MNEVDLTGNFPRLWHMAEDGSFESIMQHGLLSTSALLDLHQINGADRHALESQRRPESVAIRRAGLPAAVVRDQKPMTESALRKCLNDGLSPQEWFKILNGRTFFWLSRNRLRRLLEARAYRGRPQIVLTVDTASLIEAHRDRIELSALNSGATIYNPQPRGRDTFLPIEDYPFEEWRRRRPIQDSVVELVVRDGVPDIAGHLIAAHRIHKGKKEELWRRPKADAEDGPKSSSCFAAGAGDSCGTFRLAQQIRHMAGEANLALYADSNPLWQSFKESTSVRVVHTRL